MADPKVPHLPTEVAASGFHEHTFMGHPVFAELAGNVTYTELLALGICGRRFNAEELGVLDDIAACKTIADPRIWPLKAARLSASFGSAQIGVAAGMLATHCRYIGPYQTGSAAEFLRKVARSIEESDDVELEALLDGLLTERRYVPGFGAPFRSEDERVAAFVHCLDRRGRIKGHFYRLFERVGKWMAAKGRKQPPNMAGAIAAVLLDMELTPEQIRVLNAAISLHMFFANAFEGAAQQAPVLRQLPESTLRYEGPALRQTPRSLASR